MEMESCVPPGFRFHPTEEELVGYYLKRKVNLMKIDLDVIVDLDLYRMEPWDIQDKCRLGYEEQNEWYFFSHKDKKYPTGTRTNRATAAGFWKATGRDKAVMSKNKMIGMRKTLVFYKGRAPNGRKSDWIMHEYRLQTSEHAPPHEEGWVVCRAFKKPSPNYKQGLEAAWNHQAYYLMNRNNGNPNLPSSSSCSDIVSTTSSFSLQKPSFSFQQHEHFVEDLPQLNSPTISTTLQTNCSPSNDRDQNIGTNNRDCYNEGSTDQISQFVDWKNWDDFLPPQQQEQIETAPSFGHSTLLMSQDYELLLNSQSHETQIFTSFPNM